jgi:hypothetical protein
VTTPTDEFEQQLEAVTAKLRRIREMNGDPAAVGALDEITAELNAWADQAALQEWAARIRAIAALSAEAAGLTRKEQQEVSHKL